MVFFSNQREEYLMTKKIYLDAGHGIPVDSGAVGNGLKEAEVVLTIQQLFEAYMTTNYEGFVFNRTRSDNKTFLSLGARADKANAWDADVFISFHINSAANVAATGYEDFIYSKTQSSATKSLQNMIHDQIVPVLKKHNINNRGKKSADYAVLRETNMSAVLTESLFISNAKDAQKLKSLEILKDFASAYAEGVAKFLGLPKKKGVPAPAPTPEPTPVPKPTPAPEVLPKVYSLGDKYAFQVEAREDIGVYKYSNISENQRTLKKGTVFSVYGYTEDEKAYAVPNGFVQAKDVTPLFKTIQTGGLNKDMENEFRSFLKNEKIGAELDLNVTGNPDAEIKVAGLDLVKVKKFLDVKEWWYEVK
jgi:N-acetylmuramoyl-L-alanine amidase